MTNFIILVAAFLSCCCAFKPLDLPHRSSLITEMQTTEPDKNRRQLLTGVLGGAAALLTVQHPEPASATYSAYTNREKDWQQRNENGGIQYSTSADLRNKLREIAPQNSERSRIFCPNGPSAAVSPLMENKCGDRLATPSVFGRTDDVLGNSIPGYGSDRFSKSMGGGGPSMLEAGGGFPEYGFSK